MEFSYDVIVVGAGHAGCEAAAAAAKLGARTCLITMDMNKIAQMSCNPAIGGIAKGQIVREIDALGGHTGEVTDRTAIQFRMLNRSKGPAMWSPRAQCDRAKFIWAWREVLENTPGLSIWQDQVEELVTEEVTTRRVPMPLEACPDAPRSVLGVVTRHALFFRAPCVIITAGTFLNGLMHIGRRMVKGGRIAEPAAERLTETITRHGILFHTLHYLPDRKADPGLFKKIENFKKTEKMDIRYYPDDMSRIYYLLPGGKMVTATLNQGRQGSASYGGLTEEELDAYRSKERAIKKKGEHSNDEARCALWEQLEKIREEASKRPAPQLDDMKGMHAAERAKDLAGKSPSHILDPGKEQDAIVHGQKKDITSDEAAAEQEKQFDELDLVTALKDYFF